MINLTTLNLTVRTGDYDSRRRPICGGDYKFGCLQWVSALLHIWGRQSVWGRQSRWPTLHAPCIWPMLNTPHRPPHLAQRRYPPNFYTWHIGLHAFTPLWPCTADVPQRHKPSLWSLALALAITAMGKLTPIHIPQAHANPSSCILN